MGWGGLRHLGSDFWSLQRSAQARGFLRWHAVLTGKGLARCLKLKTLSLKPAFCLRSFIRSRLLQIELRVLFWICRDCSPPHTPPSMQLNVLRRAGIYCRVYWVQKVNGFGKQINKTLVHTHIHLWTQTHTSATCRHLQTLSHTLSLTDTLSHTQTTQTHKHSTLTHTHTHTHSQVYNSAGTITHALSCL